MSESFVGEGIEVEGEILCGETLVVQGVVRGKIASSEAVLVDAGGNLEVDIEAPRVEISGTVTGSIVASDRVELKHACRAACTINTPRLLIDEGSSFTGRVDTPA